MNRRSSWLVGAAWLATILSQAGCGDNPSARQNHNHIREMRSDEQAKASSPRRANRLAQEKSPYLLQHRHNPVDWLPWGQEAFDQARRANKPIFLSIGYSTCHWCHVMERESFEDAEIAAFLNRHFISIKVDREERPDVDKIYLTAVQAMTGQGGWPLSAFLTPELKPFYGGTYFPPQPRYGKPGFLQVLKKIHELWESQPGDLIQSAGDIHARIESFASRESNGERALDAAMFANAAALFKQDFDPVHGGFGAAPKFPQPSIPSFLLRFGRAHGDAEAVDMVLQTCRKMALGGIYDQLGGGFARYSVDERWLVPHFEKMLYDNAQLLNLYLDAWLVSRDPFFKEIARGIVGYVLRDMTHPEGGFYSAEDADSEGREGKFYCWTAEELGGLLTTEEYNVATRYFGVTRQGNFVDHSDPDPLKGQNVLSVANPDVNEQDQSLLDSARAKMLAARARRIRPHLDDKVLASWNGLMLESIARAGVVLDQPEALAAARKNAAFIRAKLWDEKSQTLYHRWREGERDRVQLLDAYAYQLAGHLSLYEATLETEHLRFALALAEAMIERFYDRSQGGFWQSEPTPDLVLRMKEDYDGAQPSGNSVAALALFKLAEICGRPDFDEAARRTTQLFGERLTRLPQAVAYLLSACHFGREKPTRIVIAGEAGLDGHRALVQAAHSVYAPNQVVLGNVGPVDDFAKTLTGKDGRATAFVCRGTSCQAPVQAPEELVKLLK